MSSSHIRVPADSTGKRVDTDELTTGSGIVQRQRVVNYPASASNTYGAQIAVPSGNTVTLVSFAAPAGWRFCGFIAGGEGDGHYFVQFDGSTEYSFRTNIAERQATVILPHPDANAGGATVEIKVTNETLSASNYEATLLGVAET